MNFRSYSLSMLVLFFFCTQLTAQTAPKLKEVGLQFSSLDLDGGSGFSAFYKKQLKENVYRRIRLFSGGLSLSTNEESVIFNLNAGIAIGREKRKSLDPKLVFYQGPEFSAGFSVTAIDEDEIRLSIKPAFGWVFGLQHSFNNRWAVNLETIPGASISVDSFSEGDSVYSFNAGFNNLVSLGLVRKF